MPANENGDGKKEYNFIEEQIMHKKKNRIKKLGFTIGMTIVLAAVFGLVSSIVFYYFGNYIRNVFGCEEAKNPITFSSPEPTVTPNPKPKHTEKEVKIIQNKLDADLQDYSKMYTLLSEVASTFNRSIVTVSSVIKGVDWFDNPSELSHASYGLVIGNNGKELLILSSKDKIENANRLRVKFKDDVEVNAELYGFDSSTGIAILAVPLDTIPDSTLENVDVAMLGDSYYVSVGTPVLALGSPNGYVYSMETGIVTDEAYDTYVTDSKLELFHTDMSNNSNGEGVIVNLNGQVIGIITHDFNTGLNSSLNTVIGITKVKSTIEKLVNRKDRIYFGIVGSDITPQYAKKMEIDSGVYVTEVEADSPAFRAGIKIGDILLSINNNNIASMNMFNNIISSYVPKTEIKVKLLRTGKSGTKKVSVALELVKRIN